jgi:O-antigen ligase
MAPAKAVPSLVRRSLVLFIFTIPLESSELVGISYVKYLAALCFFGSYFFYNNPFSKSSLPKIPQPMWWFSPYVAIYLAHGLAATDASVNQFLMRVMTLMQLMVFCWLAASILQSKEIMRNVLVAYSAGCVILVVGMALNLPGLSGSVKAGRVMAEGYDPNGMAITLSLAVLAVIGMCLNGTFKQFSMNISALLLILPLTVAILRTGSRSGMLALALGFLVYLLPFWKTRRKAIAWTLAVIGAAGLVWLLVTNSDFSRRWEVVVYEGSTSGRERIYATGFEMFLERPLFGWGHVASREELGERLGLIGRQRDPHNIVLEMLLQVGALGAIPFLIGLLYCVRASWRSRRGPGGLLSMALIVLFGIGGMAGPLLTKKAFWLVLAIAIRSTVPVPIRSLAQRPRITR